jgi:hypothetical protein
MSNPRKIYVYSKPLPTHESAELRPRLIGTLTELKPGGNKPEQYGEYEFEYTFSTKATGKFPEWFMQLEEFPDTKRVYTNTTEVLRFIKRFLPTADYRFLDKVFESRSIKEYNELAFLSHTGNDMIKLNETLPQNIIVY